MNSFTEVLTSFVDAVQANHGRRLAILFTEDGIYEDGFFGSHVGRSAIAAMLQRFHDTGSSYLWEFVDPVSSGVTGYARFRFSYTSRLRRPARTSTGFHPPEGARPRHFSISTIFADWAASPVRFLT